MWACGEASALSAWSHHSSLDTLEWRPQGDLDGRLGMSLVGGRESETEWAVRCGHQSSMLRCFAMQLACCWVPRDLACGCADLGNAERGSSIASTFYATHINVRLSTHKRVTNPILDCRLRSPVPKSWRLSDFLRSSRLKMISMCTARHTDAILKVT